MEKDKFVIKIGPKLRAALDEQKIIIKEVTYSCVNPSDYEAGEILAMKVIKVLKKPLVT